MKYWRVLGLTLLVFVLCSCQVKKDEPTYDSQRKDKKVETAFDQKASTTANADKDKPKPEVKPEPTGTVSKYAKVTVDSLNMRQQANVTSGVVGKIQANEFVTILSESSGWSRVETKAGRGYVKTEFLEKLKGLKTAPASTIVTSGQTATATSLQTLSKGTEVGIISSSTDSAGKTWYKVYVNGVEGYVQGTDLQ